MNMRNLAMSGRNLRANLHLNYIGFRITERTNKIRPSSIESSALITFAVVNLSSLQFRQARITSSFLKSILPVSPGITDPELGELPP